MGQTIIQRGFAGYPTVQDEGTSLTVRPIINVVGRGIIVDDNSSKTRIRVLDAASMFFIKDDFVSAALTAGFIGELGWSMNFATATHVNGETNSPGIIRFNTAASTAHAVALTYGNASGIFSPANTFDSLFILRPSVADTTIQLRIGFDATVTNDPDTDGIYFEKLAADVNWFVVTRSGSIETRTNTNIAVGTAFKKFRIRREDASTISFSIDGGAEINHTTNIPTTALQPMFTAKPAEAVAKYVDADYFDLFITGITR